MASFSAISVPETMLFMYCMFSNRNRRPLAKLGGCITEILKEGRKKEKKEDTQWPGASFSCPLLKNKQSPGQLHVYYILYFMIIFGEVDVAG